MKSMYQKEQMIHYLIKFLKHMEVIQMLNGKFNYSFFVNIYYYYEYNFNNLVQNQLEEIIHFVINLLFVIMLVKLHIQLQDFLIKIKYKFILTINIQSNFFKYLKDTVSPDLYQIGLTSTDPFVQELFLVSKLYNESFLIFSFIYLFVNIL